MATRTKTGFLVALGFLTVIPSPLRREATPQEWGRSLIYFPIIGLGIGGILYGLDRLFALFMPSALINILLLAALVLLTGAHHLDGFIDTCDGMAAGRSREERLEIMRDSRAGGLGVVGACLLLLAKYVFLLFLPGPLRMAGLLLMPALGRWAMVSAIFGYPYARRTQGMGRIFKEQARWQWLSIATLVAVAASSILLWLSGSTWLLGLALMAAVLLLLITMAGFLSRRLGGLTGDTYGAINEVTEVTVLILIPLLCGGYF